MYLYQVLCVVLSVTVARIDADCPYEGEVLSLEPCDKKQPNLATFLKPYSIKLVSGNCDVAVTGCLELHQDVNSVKVKWTAWHNKNQIHKGEKEACGFKFGKMVVNCPAKKGTKICSKSEEVKNPVGPVPLGMFMGNMKIKYEAITDKGVTQCWVGEGKMYKK